jgi:hypothetical protein
LKLSTTERSELMPQRTDGRQHVRELQWNLKELAQSDWSNSAAD